LYYGFVFKVSVGDVGESGGVMKGLITPA